ncbi:MAG: hypothetical protein JXB34_14540 [Bacteroidales bacterium]|nr:hypothetical protein [Bacteroidales bacterium]
MKTFSKLITAVLGVLMLISCQDKIEETYKINSPVYMTYGELRNSFKVAAAEDIVKPGKIYFKDNFIYVNEYQKGIHVVDNADPANPQVIKFIEIPGNVDMAIRGNMLYADSYVDLLTIDISDIENIKEVDRDTNVFPYIIPDVEEGIVESVNQFEGVVVGYTVTEKTEKVESSVSFPRFLQWEDTGFRTNSWATDKAMATGGGSETGTGGSMARFTIYDSYLYTVSTWSLNLFDLQNTANPVFIKEIYVGWGIETIFPYEDKLFLGSMQGMYIYSVENPLNPFQISQFRHASACDPVVADGGYAYVTLRGGNLCGAIESQLNVIDISNLLEPKLINTVLLTEPYGLGIDSSLLFICDGNAGLKIYNSADKNKIAENLIVHYPDIHAFDVIPLGNVLVMIGIDGLYQYDYSRVDSIYELSHIPIYGNRQ